MPSMDAARIGIEIPQPLQCCNHLPHFDSREDRLVVICSICGREAGIPKKQLPPNCHSPAMAMRETRKQVAKAVREWNTLVLAPHERPGEVVA